MDWCGREPCPLHLVFQPLSVDRNEVKGMDYGTGVYALNLPSPYSLC